MKGTKKKNTTKVVTAKTATKDSRTPDLKKNPAKKRAPKKVPLKANFDVKDDSPPWISIHQHRRRYRQLDSPSLLEQEEKVSLSLLVLAVFTLR
jgi:hypothetical protein